MNPLGKPDIQLIIQADQITLARDYIFMRQKPTQYVTLWAKCHFFCVWSQLRFDPAAALKTLVVGHGVGVLSWLRPGGRGTETPC